MQGDPYKILGVKAGASQEAIRRAYLKRAKAIHPDKNLNRSTANQEFQNLQTAYKILSNQVAGEEGRFSDNASSNMENLKTAFSQRKANGFPFPMKETWISDLYKDLAISGMQYEKYWFSGEADPIVQGDIRQKTDFRLYNKKDNFALCEEGNCIKAKAGDLIGSNKIPNDIKKVLKGVGDVDVYILEAKIPIDQNPELIFYSKNLDSITKLLKSDGVSYAINEDLERQQTAQLLKSKLESSEKGSVR